MKKLFMLFAIGIAGTLLIVIVATIGWYIGFSLSCNMPETYKLIVAAITSVVLTWVLFVAGRKALIRIMKECSRRNW